MFLCCVCCVLCWQWSLGRADHSLDLLRIQKISCLAGNQAYGRPAHRLITVFTELLQLPEMHVVL